MRAQAHLGVIATARMKTKQKDQMGEGGRQRTWVAASLRELGLASPGTTEREGDRLRR